MPPQLHERQGKKISSPGRSPLGRAGSSMRDPGPPLCLAREIGIFVGVPDDDAGVVIRHPLARRGTRVVDLGQRRGSRSPCGPQNIRPTCGNRIPRKKGNRGLNKVLHMIAVCQARSDPRGRAYYHKKVGEGKSRRELCSASRGVSQTRCLRRSLLTRRVLLLELLDTEGPRMCVPESRYTGSCISVS